MPNSATKTIRLSSIHAAVSSHKFGLRLPPFSLKRSQRRHDPKTQEVSPRPSVGIFPARQAEALAGAAVLNASWQWLGGQLLMASATLLSGGAVTYNV